MISMFTPTPCPRSQPPTLPVIVGQLLSLTHKTIVPYPQSESPNQSTEPQFSQFHLLVAIVLCRRVKLGLLFHFQISVACLCAGNCVCVCLNLLVN
ncbi:hypothetical protein Hanom_Chr06g00490921 [Helianthus anomalus]